MSRELNNDLFPEVKPVEKKTPEQASAALSRARDEQLREVVMQVEQLKRRHKEMEAKVENTNMRLNEFANTTKVKFERLVGITQRLDEMIKSNVQDMVTKQSQMASKLNERKVGDAKIQELVDRHNQLVQSFEVRLLQMQKVVAEQEMQLMSSRSELKEAIREMARLKRV